MLQILIEKWLFVGAVAGFVLFWAWESLARLWRNEAVLDMPLAT